MKPLTQAIIDAIKASIKHPKDDFHKVRIRNAQTVILIEGWRAGSKKWYSAGMLSILLLPCVDTGTYELDFTDQAEDNHV